VEGRLDAIDTDAESARGLGPTEPHTGRAFVVSLIGLAVPPVAVVGLVMSLTAYGRARRLSVATGLAVAGIVCGAIGCFILVNAVIFLAGYFIGASM
jgi:hypothetical protein